MVRKTLAVISGFTLWSVLWLAANAVATTLAPEAYNEDGMTESTGLLVIFLVLSLVFSIGAGFLTAAIARTPSPAPAWALGGLLLAVGIIVQIQYWDAMPLWFHIPFLAMLVPGVIVGARLRQSRPGANDGDNP